MLAEGRSHERRAGHYKDLTETGNRARKVSGTQGPRGSAKILFLGPRRTQRITEVRFEFPLILIAKSTMAFFNRPIMARTQIRVHRWGRRTRILARFSQTDLSRG